MFIWKNRKYGEEKKEKKEKIMCNLFRTKGD